MQAAQAVVSEASTPLNLDLVEELADPLAVFMIGEYGAEDWQDSPLVETLARVAALLQVDGRGVPDAILEALRKGRRGGAADRGGMSAMSARRNPLRAYDADGREIEPMTLGGMRTMGVRSLDVTCNKCGREATVNCDRWADDVPVPDVRLRLRCSRCGSKDLHTMLCMPEYYASAHGITRL